jgi:hypothetical protein
MYNHEKLSTSVISGVTHNPYEVNKMCDPHCPPVDKHGLRIPLIPSELRTYYPTVKELVWGKIEKMTNTIIDHYC